MKPSLFFIILLVGCSSVTLTSAEKPSGEEIFDLVLRNSSLPLQNEPLCDVKSFTRKGENLTLGEHFSTNLSVSYESNNQVSIISSCSRSKHDLSETDVIEVWDCKLEILETSKKGTFISSSMIAFSSDLEKSKIIEGSIRCF